MLFLSRYHSRNSNNGNKLPYRHPYSAVVLFDDPKLNAKCRDIIRNPDFNIIVSTVSASEIATKYRIGKLPEAKQIVEKYSQILN